MCIAKLEHGKLKERIVFDDIARVIHVQRGVHQYDRVVATMNDGSTKKIGIRHTKLARFFFVQVYKGMGQPAPGPSGVLTGRECEGVVAELKEKRSVELVAGEQQLYHFNFTSGDKEFTNNSIFLTSDRLLLFADGAVDIIELDNILAVEKKDSHALELKVQQQGKAEESTTKSITAARVEVANFFLALFKAEIRLRQGEEPQEKEDIIDNVEIENLTVDETPPPAYTPDDIDAGGAGDYDEDGID